MSTPTSPYAAIAADLHAIADALAGIDKGDPSPYIRLSFMPGHSGDPYEEHVAHIDAVAQALFGRPAESTFSPNEYGTHSHKADGKRGHVAITVHGRVTPPGQRDKDAELADLRTQLAEARAELAGAYHPAVRAQTRATPDVGDDPAGRYRPGDRVGIDLASGGTLRGQVVNWHSRSNTGNGWQPGYLVDLDSGMSRWFAVDRVRLLATDAETAAVPDGDLAERRRAAGLDHYGGPSLCTTDAETAVPAPAVTR